MSPPPHRSADAQELAVAVAALVGVASSRVVRGRGGPQVRLRLAPGADAEQVADAVRRHLAGLDDVIDLTAQTAAPSAPAGENPGGEPAGEPPVVPAGEGSAPLVVVETAAREPAGSPHDAPSRLALTRTRVGVQGWAAVAEVALADGAVVHVGAAEAAATADGSRRALAAAAAQALESAGAGALRIEVDGVQVEPVAGRAAAVVALSVVSARGAEQLIGCALVGDDPGRAVVNAVLSAANRRIELAMAERAGPSAG